MPKRIRCDSAGEYISGALAKFLDLKGILPEFSNPYEQFGSGTSETFVDSIGKGIHTLLLQSHLPPEFWSAAAHYWMDVYNHIPHWSIGDQIPYTMHHGAKPD
eukprot:1596471-Rhodomonas_salina.1